MADSLNGNAISRQDAFGSELERAVTEAVAKQQKEANAELIGNLSAAQEERLGSVIS